MRPVAGDIVVLARRIDAARNAQGWNYAELARRGGVHASQTQRICEGKFRAISQNVMRICTILGVDIDSLKTGGDQSDPLWDEFQRNIRQLWDGTPEGADAIIGLIRAAVAVRSRD